MFKISHRQEECLIKEELKELVARTPLISYQIYRDLRMNSYERAWIIQFVDRDCLEQIASDYLKNVTSAPTFPTTYEEMIIHIIFPEMIRRF